MRFSSERSRALGVQTLFRTAPLAVVFFVGVLAAAILATVWVAEHGARNDRQAWRQTAKAAALLDQIEDLSGTSTLIQVNEVAWALEDLQRVLPLHSEAQPAVMLAFRQVSNLRDSLRFVRATGSDATAAHVRALLSEARNTLALELHEGGVAYVEALRQGLWRWSVFVVAALLFFSAVCARYAYRHWYRPVSSLRSVLGVYARKERSGKNALKDAELEGLTPSLRANLQAIDQLLREGDQWASQLAQRAKGFQASQQMLELARAIPGVVFQYEYLPDGTRINHFISPKAHSFFGAEGDAVEVEYGEESAAPAPVPLALTHSLFDHVAHQRNATARVLEYDTKVDCGGSVRWIRTLATASAQNNGATVVNGVWLDVSENIEKTQALAQAHTDAEQVAREKARLLAVMSHEIRTPLNGILGMAQLALKEEAQGNQRERIRKILGSGHHLMEIVNDVLDLSKIESGQLVLEQAPFSLQQLVAEVSELLAPRVAEKGLEMWLDVPASLDGQWIGDPLRLKQILLNFTANAIKFTQAGEVSIRARVLDESENAKADADGSALLLIEVHDTGIGIAAQDQKNLFQAFHQTDASITRKYGGTGLGLAISSHFAQLLGGQTGVRSRPGEGSVFWFTARIRRSVQPPQAPAAFLHHKKILVAESHANARTALCKVLREGFACEVFEADSGQEVLQFLQTQPVELCILTTRLVDMNARFLMQELRQKGLFTGLVWLVGFADAPELEELGLLPEVQILQKPLGIHALTQACAAAKVALSNQGMSATQGQPDTKPATMPVRRFLVVDDNALNRAIAAEFLQGRGDIRVEVDLAENGRQAVERVLANQQTPYDAVLMDLQMPVMDGLAATRELGHLLDELPPIFAMSAHHEDEREQQALDCGMLDFIHKPLVERQMWEVLDEWGITSDSSNATTARSAATAAEAFQQEVWEGLARSLSLPRATQLAQQFLQQSSHQLEELDRAIREQELEKASSVLHQLSGTAGSFGLMAAGDLSSRMSEVIRAGALKELAPMMMQLREVTEAGQTQLRALIEG